MHMLQESLAISLQCDSEGGAVTFLRESTWYFIEALSRYLLFDSYRKLLVLFNGAVVVDGGGGCSA